MTDNEKRKKKLINYLADYIEHEIYEKSRFVTELDLQMLLNEGIDAFESVENMEVFVV